MEKMISIVVPVYQGEGTIAACVESILKSSYQNLEVVVVNDGSTDKTSQIVRKLQERDSRVVLVETAGGGVSKARNTGLLHTHGEYIGFVDSDDAVDVAMYEKLMQQMDDGCDMVTCASYHCQVQGERNEKENGSLEAYERTCPERALETVIYEKTTMAVWSKVFRRSILWDEAGNLQVRFRENQSHYEDFLFICEYVARCRGGIRFVPERLYYYTSSPGGLSRQRLSASAMKESLEPLLELGKAMGEDVLGAAELFYAETFVKQWYTEWLQRDGTERAAECETLKVEADRFRRRYLRTGQVSLVRRAAAWMMFYCEPVAKLIVKVFGGLIK